MQLGVFSCKIDSSIIIYGGRKADLKRIKQVKVLNTKTDTLDHIVTLNKERIAPDHYPCTLSRDGHLGITADGKSHEIVGYSFTANRVVKIAKLPF